MKFPEKTFFNLNGALHLLFLIAFVAALGTTGTAQKSKSFFDTRTVAPAQPSVVAEPSVVAPTQILPEAAPTPTSGPISFPGSNTSCSDLVGNPNFPNVTAATNELKYGESGSDYNFTDTFFFKTYSTTHGPVVAIPANDPRFNTKTITFTISQASQVHTLESFASQQGISAVIFKLGPDSFAWDYDIPGQHYTFIGGPLSINHPNGFSHITFCFEDSLRPTAADASVSGRVLSAEGRAVSGAIITITNAGTGQTYRALTNPFGYYTVEGLDSGEFYIATIAKKGTKFVEDTKSFSLTDNLADLDFVANQ